MSALDRRNAFCEEAVHAYLKAHPGDLKNLRPWPELRDDIGECPGCDATLHISWSDERRQAEGVPTRAEEEAEDAAAEGRAA